MQTYRTIFLCVFIDPELYYWWFFTFTVRNSRPYNQSNKTEWNQILGLAEKAI